MTGYFLRSKSNLKVVENNDVSTTNKPDHIKLKTVKLKKPSKSHKNTIVDSYPHRNNQDEIVKLKRYSPYSSPPKIEKVLETTPVKQKKKVDLKQRLPKPKLKSKRAVDFFSTNLESNNSKLSVRTCDQVKLEELIENRASKDTTPPTSPVYSPTLKAGSSRENSISSVDDLVLFETESQAFFSKPNTAAVKSNFFQKLLLVKDAPSSPPPSKANMAVNLKSLNKKGSSIKKSTNSEKPKLARKNIKR
ncbi:hypothetical protein HK099_004443, partial [Clydaea vesicula]